MLQTCFTSLYISYVRDELYSIQPYFLMFCLLLRNVSYCTLLLMKIYYELFALPEWQCKDHVTETFH